jgi:mono/diheme cytochrome c family protein
MREKLARFIALLTGQLVLLLAIAFAVIQNPSENPDATESRKPAPPSSCIKSIVPDPGHIDAGNQIYQQQLCARCHSIAGEGNPRNPLDGVGARRTADELRDWIIGADVLQGTLPERAFTVKQAYGELSGGDLDALVTYMQSLRF